MVGAEFNPSRRAALKLIAIATISEAAWLGLDKVARRSMGLALFLKRIPKNMAYEITVDDAPFNAIGDGVTDDRPAFLAMAAATGGIIRCTSKTYNISNLVLPYYAQVILQGDCQPQPNAAFTQLEGGTVLVGGLNLVANAVLVEKCGFDTGIARGYSPATMLDGLVIDSPSGSTGNCAIVRNVSSLGPGESGTSHGVLIQGFTSGIVSDVVCAARDYGVVTKCHNFVIHNISGDYIQTALVFPKSDLPAYANNVGDASATNFSITNINNRCSSGNATCSAVYLMGSTASFSKASVAGVMQQGGHSPLRIQGGGSLGGPSSGGITAASINSDSAQYGFFAGGYTYDWQVSGITASNPASGQLFYVDTPTTNWKITGSSLLISNPAIASTIAGTAAGTMGLFDNISVRNPYAGMTFTISSGASVTAGRVIGNATG